MEIVVDALRKEVNNEDRCDIAIKRALEKGPPRVRIASREELKMEINNYKNVSLKLMRTLKDNNLKVPGFANETKLMQKETGIRQEDTMQEAGALDHLEQSAGESHLSMDGGELDESGIADE